MKAAIALLPLDFSQGNIIDLMVRSPCRVLAVTLVAEPQGLVLAERNGQSRMVARAALVIEIDPSAAEVPRRFVGVPLGIQVDTADPALACNSLIPCGVAFVPPHGRPLAIYEAPILQPVADAPAIEIATS